MKKLYQLIIIFIIANSTNVNAQYVSVADNNFKIWLQQQYPTCFNGDLLDTTCIEIVNETELILPFQSDYEFVSILEIQYFDNLQKLFCQQNSIINIGRFPLTLEKISIIGQPLNSIPVLPPSLDTLIITYSSLNTINGSFPPTLKYLNLMYSNTLFNIPQLPEHLEYLNLRSCPNLQGYIQSVATLPTTLNFLTLGDCQLNILPELNDGLLQLVCDGNNLTVLPALPEGINEVFASVNQIDSITNLPNSILALSLDYNLLTSMPPLPTSLLQLSVSNNMLTYCPDIQTGQVFLDCSNNFITELNGNFNNLQHLNCSNNQLTSIPDFTPYNFLFCLYCQNNNISCFPPFSILIQDTLCLNISNNPATCVPNYVGAMNQLFMQSYPLCVFGDTLNNPNNCQDAVGIYGATYKDENSNCNLDSLDGLLKNIKINFYNPINDLFYTTFSHHGVYSSILPYAQYIVSVDTSGYYYVNCEYPGVDTLVQINASNVLADDVNFSLECKDGIDVGVQSIVNSGIVFPGQYHRLMINAGDLSQWNNLNCAINTGGTITININGPVTYAYSNANSLIPNVSGNVLTYEIINFGLINNSEAFDLMLLTDTTALMNDQICIEVIVEADSVEANYSNNTKSICYHVVNSYDPNFKMVSPVDVLPGFEDWLTYTIYFQNLGNAPAFNVRILDTLDSNLNFQTFEVINYSHFNTTTVNNGIITFRFPNIMLPDSASNPEGSIGFIQYRIKPNANLPAGTQLKNTAHIYFDFNPAIVTNTTVNEYVTTVTTSAKNIENDLRIFPNPSNGLFYVGSNTKVKSLEVFDFVGNLIMQKSNINNFNLSDFSNGIYLVRVNGNQYSKVVKN